MIFGLFSAVPARAQAPSGLTATAATSKSVSLAWTGSASSYVVQRAPLGGSSADLEQFPAPPPPIRRSTRTSPISIKCWPSRPRDAPRHPMSSPWALPPRGSQTPRRPRIPMPRAITAMTFRSFWIGMEIPPSRSSSTIPIRTPINRRRSCCSAPGIAPNTSGIPW